MVKFVFIIISCITIYLKAAEPLSFNECLDVDGIRYTVRPATTEDFANPLVTKDLKPERVAEYKRRVQENIVSMFLVVNAEGEIVKRVVAGSLPLYISPWPLEEGSADHARLMPILGMYDELITALGMEPNHTAGKNFLLAHPDCPALTLILKGKFATVSVQEAIVGIVQKNHMKIPARDGFSPAYEPIVCVSLLKKPISSSGNQTERTAVHKGLQYYREDETKNDKGFRDFVITSMVDGKFPPKFKW